MIDINQTVSIISDNIVKQQDPIVTTILILLIGFIIVRLLIIDRQELVSI